MDYEIEELLPIVAELAEKCTSKESTSISYEKAGQLMEAALYCIHQNVEENSLCSREKVSAKEAYRLGYETLVKKVKETQNFYNEMIVNFKAYGNENYYNTVTKAISGFFMYYDVKFAPQETIITMDYPTICPVTGCTGIDAIAKYVEYISYEQRFLSALPEAYVVEVLLKFQCNYKKQFDNICSVLLRHILGCLCIERKIGVSGTEQDYIRLDKMIKECEKNELQEKLINLLRCLVENKYQGDERLFEYLKGDVENFVEYLINGSRYDKLKRVLVI